MKRRREKQPPPYLDGRVAGNSVSARRSMRTPAGRFMQFFLCVMMLMAFSVQKASAYDDWNNKWISQWYDPINATIVLDIRVYQSWGGGDDGHCGFIGDDGYLTVTVAGYGIKINGPSGTWNNSKDFKKYVKNDDGKTLNKDVSVEWLGDRVVTSNGKSAYYLKITVPLTQDRIGKDQEVYYNGKWWRRTKTATDQKVDFTEIVDTRYGCTPTIITNAYYGVKQNKPGYFIDWKKNGTATNKSIDRYGYYFICDSEGKEINGTDSLVGSQTSGSLFIPTERMSLDNFSDYKVKQKYTPSNNNKVTYSTLSDSYTRPAYPQVNEISANYDQVTRKMKVNWNLSAAPTQNCIEDNMVLTIKSTDRATNAVETTTQNIKYMAGKTAYSYEFDVPLGRSMNYEFRVKRSHTGNSDVWNNAFSKQTSLDVSTKHSNVTAGSVHAVLDEEAKTATITWQTEGDTWSSGTKAVLTRLNVTTNTTDNIELSKEEFLSGKYVDDMIMVCNEYRYRLTVKPAEAYGTLPTVAAPESIMPTSIGNLVAFTAGKGYYSDRVELAWSSKGNFERFVINRKEHGAPDTDYKQIAVTEGNEAQNDYYYNDVNAVPGVVYDYQIKGQVMCSGNLLESDEVLTDVGFRTPTGDIYGRVTFESGQAVSGAKVSAEATDGSGVPGKSYVFTGASNLTVDNDQLLNDATQAATLQAWVRAAKEGTIIEKSGMYKLAYKDKKIEFSAGTQTLKTPKKLSEFVSSDQFVHLSAVASATHLIIYINGEAVAEAERTAQITGNNNKVVMGEGFEGAIDEVRLWNKALSADTIASDYDRYLVGNEDGLQAYYTFDYSVDDAFYDISYKGTKYNMNHGVATGVTISAKDIPTSAQLGHSSYTSVDGSYQIRSLPYTGNGTTYMIVPTLGIHQFASAKELRLINSQAQSHTVNFTDKSSFNISGKVMYKGGNVPVEGVSFAVDGVTVMDGKSNIVKTDAHGQFTISVPVGQHEVKAVLANHTFENGGKLTNSDGTDRNYQDDDNGFEIFDVTTVRYIGRVAGGTKQEAFPVGHSLSKNNLADDVRIELTYQNEAYKMTTEARETTLNHVKGVYVSKQHQNRVAYDGNKITIYPDAETGEFYADLIPEKYKINVVVPGHDNIPGSGEDLNLSNEFAKQSEVNEYVDSISTQGKFVNCSDTVYYNKKQQFIKRYTPSILVKEKVKGKLQDFFGKEELTVATLDQTKTIKVKTYNPDNAAQPYTLGVPVYEQGQYVTYHITTAEVYEYKDKDGRRKDGVKEDIVPTPEAKLSFSRGDIAYGTQEDITTDKNGEAEWTFQVNNPEMTSALRSAAMDMTYSENSQSTSSTTINWKGGFDGKGNTKAIVIGAKTLGSDFVTNGPDKVLFVLRDPPGSNSYAYLEKGVTVTSTSSYEGNVTNEGVLNNEAKIGLELMTFAGVGAGKITNNEIKDEYSFGVSHSETIGGTDTDTKTMTTTTRFETSSDPQYVGADGDLFVGFSTNIGVGKTQNIAVVSREMYQSAPNKYELFGDVTPAANDYLLVKATGLGLSQKYGTMFIYPQVHIEKVLLPKLEEVRNSMLHQQSEALDFQAMADNTKLPVYVSKLATDDPNYGKSNNDKVFGGANADDPCDGPSYKIYAPKGVVMKEDTIMYLNQSIENWKTQLRNNEEQKVKAELMQNHSFQGGASYEYSEEYGVGRSETTRFSLLVGAQYSTNVGWGFDGTGFVLNIDEKVTTEHGGEFTNEETARHCKGYVLAEEGSDYISVDVCREAGYKNGDQYIKYKDMKNEEGQTFSTFIFKTRGGATSCPYEGEYKTKYYESGQHVINEATVQMEVPEITVEKDFIENVPSGKSAYFTLYLRNNSESQDDNWYNLVIDDSSNPNGAQLLIDGAPIGNGRALLVPAGGTLTKTLEVRKGSVMNYDNLRLMLQSQCQCDPTDFQDEIYDDVTFSVHFTPSATDVNLKKPTDNWTYNTKLPTAEVNGVQKHYMDVVIDGFDVNYDNFHRIMLQYKPSSGSDNDWTTLMSYYNDQALYDQAVKNGMNAEMIKAADAGTIKYSWFMDDLQDQRYDLRTVGTSMINNAEVYNYSAVHSGIKDMYNPRLFGSAQPANGVLTVNDEVKLTFNEPIADGLLTDNNFSVTGIRNGAQTDHSVSVRLDGKNDELVSEFQRNWSGKNLTVEMWTLADKAQDAVLFSQGNANSAIELATTSDNRLKVKVADKTIVSDKAFDYEQGTWAHVALVYNNEGNVSAYYNYEQLISAAEVGEYNGEGAYVFGASVDGSGHFAGKMHGARIWDKVLTPARLQTNSLTMLSGAESNLIAYYPMSEAKGDVLADKAHGANLEMRGAEWANPEGRAVAFNGKDQYLKLSSGSSCVVDNTMDYTIETWFKADEAQQTATIISNGRGDGEDMGGSLNLFALNLEEGRLVFHNNGVRVACDGSYADNDWHHVAVAVNRTSGRAQIYVDGKLNTYFEAADLGGIAAAYIHLGARVWTPADNLQQEKADNFFKGEIDEVRVWNLYKSETLVENGNSNRLDGTEKGLLAYYPFETYIEWQGVKELQFSLKDQKQQADPTQKVPDAVVVGGDVETKTSAPVKAKGPESKLLYDFVVNNDALIINLKEPYERIEKTIVKFTVDGVRDKNGNEILSPITWSAFIDRNQLKWSDRALTVVKKLNEEKTIRVKALNNGGSIEHFTVENLPSWLEAEPASGTIDPTASQDIVLTIDPSLNIGTYDETLYLRGDNNVVEALQLTVKVEGEKPDWTVNAADFKYNMSVFGKLYINKVYSSDDEDMLAAFSGGKCVGVCNNRYYKQNDMYYAMLTVYSNEVSSDNLEFRIWDASTGQTYIAESEKPISFENNAVVGSPSQPVLFTAKDYRVQNITLNEGWTWISTNIASDKLSDLNKLLADGKWTSDDQVKNEQYGFASWTKRNGWMGQLTAIDNDQMYLVHSSQPQSLHISGPVVDPTSHKLTIRGAKADGTARWNYISYLPSDNFTLKEALAGYDAKEGDIVKSQTQMAMYSGNLGWIGSLTYMENGKGYMLQRQSQDDAQLQYPSKTSVGRKAKAVKSADEPTAYFPYSANMTAVVEVEGVELQQGDRLVSYVAGEPRGYAEAIALPDGRTVFMLTIGGDKPEAVDVTVERDGDVVAKAPSAVSYAANSNVGTLSEPMRISFLGTEGGLYIYPSPFYSQLKIRAIVDRDAYTDVYVSDMSGKRIVAWNDCNAGGNVDITWNAGNTVPAGVYIVSIAVDGNVYSMKAIKK
ncbi:T9SS type A sorting domain-containing protein [Prevotella stercorea]|uniref:LamG-like jellyroll fold domain-containing protein n=1 Tax=Leyella stercorea TaxID=363265 RepID=UPI001C2BB307|nr:LamG-like jellyroll fold domain-containing protein [Leyella stercorea]MBU9898314.1 T9SS type A sorting domain-containing protein [Leyella stercorea]MBU9945938.1 T9SS type A sorting domain-containing protein [Leyella stercorea]